MGKAARLNRERREKESNNNSDWKNFIVKIHAKESQLITLKKTWIDAGFSGALLCEGINGTFFNLAFHAIHKTGYVDRLAFVDGNTIKTTVFVIEDNDSFWENSNEIAYYISIDFRGQKHNVICGIDECKARIRDEDLPLFHAILGYPKDLRPLFWSKNGFDVFFKDGLGYGVPNPNNPR